MTITTVPTPARTDSGAAVATTTPSTTPTAATDAATDRLVRRAGALMAVGAASWAATIFTVSSNSGTVLGERLHDGAGLIFQAGVFGVVTAMARTGALAPTRGNRVFLRAERVVLSIAMLWTCLHFYDYEWADRTGWVVAIDVCWPLSMLGMLVLGIKVFRARRWRGSLRTAPLVAETWVAFAVPAFALSTALDQPLLAQVVAGTHLLVGYTRLGLLMNRHPELTRPS